MPTTPPPPYTKPKPLFGFTRLNDQVSLYKPPNFATSLSLSDKTPTTILLCAWMNASPKNIDYYARTYQSLYPRAQIIILTISTKQAIFESETRRRRDILPAVHAILAVPKGKERVLVHSFSNGGAKRTYGLAGVYQALTGQVFMPKTLIFDSALGMPRFARTMHAIAIPARKLRFLSWLFFMSATAVMAAITSFAVYWLPKRVWYDFVWGPTLGLKNMKIVGGGTKMGFVYSKEDLAIDWRDVEKWAGEAEKKGYGVVRKLVEGAEHAQMFRGRGGEKDYWGWVEQMWERGLDAQTEGAQAEEIEAEKIQEVGMKKMGETEVKVKEIKLNKYIGKRPENKGFEFEKASCFSDMLIR